MGRKKLPAAKARQKPLRIRLNEAERALVDAAAKSKDCSTSTWAREQLLRLAQAAAAKNT